MLVGCKFLCAQNLKRNLSSKDFKDMREKKTKNMNIIISKLLVHTKFLTALPGDITYLNGGPFICVLAVVPFSSSDFDHILNAVRLNMSVKLPSHKVFCFFAIKSIIEGNIWVWQYSALSSCVLLVTLCFVYVFPRLTGTLLIAHSAHLLFIFLLMVYQTWSALKSSPVH